MKQILDVLLRAGLVGSLILAVPALAGTALSYSSLQRPAQISKRNQGMAMLAIARAGERLVSVGENGVVLLSDDTGKTWRQAKVPVSVSLTAVQFIDAKQGWATGHMGVVLHTGDGGETWIRQLDGVSAAKLILAEAQARGASERELADAQHLVDDGPDKPFLNLYFRDAQHGYVFGAYNLILRTDDGGKSWQPWLNRLDNPKALHLYAMAASGNALWLAGEQGLLLRSDDGGEHFKTAASPYKGSYFGLEGGPHGELLLYGLRGHAYVSNDTGKTWREITTGVAATLSSGGFLADGRLTLASQAGEILLGHVDDLKVAPLAGTPPLPLADFAQAADGSLVGASLLGVKRIGTPTPLP